MNEKIKWNVPADDYEFQIYPVTMRQHSTVTCFQNGLNNDQI